MRTADASRAQPCITPGHLARSKKKIEWRAPVQGACRGRLSLGIRCLRDRWRRRSRRACCRKPGSTTRCHPARDGGWIDGDARASMRNGVDTSRDKLGTRLWRMPATRSLSDARRRPAERRRRRSLNNVMPASAKACGCRRVYWDNCPWLAESGWKCPQARCGRADCSRGSRGCQRGLAVCLDGQTNDVPEQAAFASSGM